MAKMFHRGPRSGGLILVGALLLKVTSFESSAEAGVAGEKNARIRLKGSDRMIQLGVAWAEAYHKIAPNVSIDMNGSGPDSPRFAALANNSAEICLSVRRMRPDEREKVKEGTGKDVNEFVVAYDALAVYTNPKNPIREISVEDLTQIWAEGGTITSWDQVDPKLKGKIVLFGRQNNSSTYDYFREHICGKTPEGKQREFRPGISEMNGSSEVVENVAKTPLAMGYSGMGYKTDKVNWLKVSNKKVEPGIEPGADVARSGKYPIARKLYLYTAGEPKGEVKEFIDWVLSPAGQKVVEQERFIPIRQERLAIRMTGSGEVINLAFAWAEAYRNVKSNVSIEMNGAGPGDDPLFSALANNNTDICLAARQITPEEAERIKTGKWTRSP